MFEIFVCLLVSRCVALQRYCNKQHTLCQGGFAQAAQRTTQHTQADEACRSAAKRFAFDGEAAAL
jgi:hypothetical protein